MSCVVATEASILGPRGLRDSCRIIQSFFTSLERLKSSFPSVKVADKDPNHWEHTLEAGSKSELGQRWVWSRRKRTETFSSAGTGQFLGTDC